MVLARWLSTVLDLIPRLLATTSLMAPEAISSSTSISRPVRSSGAGYLAAGGGGDYLPAIDWTTGLWPSATILIIRLISSTADFFNMQASTRGRSIKQ